MAAHKAETTLLDPLALQVTRSPCSFNASGGGEARRYGGRIGLAARPPLLRMSTITPARDLSGPFLRLATGFAVLLAAGLAASSALAIGEGSKAAVVLPLAVAAALVLACLSLVRFAAFVVVMLVIRASIDLGRLSGDGGGTLARLLNPSSILAVLFVITAGAWLVAQRDREGRIPGSSLRTALIVFVFSCLLSVVGARDALASLVETVRIFAAVMMFVVIEQLARDPARVRQILKAVYASALFPLALVVFSFASGNPRAEQKGGFLRVVGPFTQSNVFGRYLMLIVVMGVAIFPYVDRRWRRSFGVLLAGSSICLLFTYTRSALIGTALGLIAVGLYQNRRVLGGLLVAGAIVALLIPSVSGRFTELATGRANDPNPGNSLGWRLSYWTEVLPLARKNPVTGIGVAQTQYFTDRQVQPHNDLLRAYVETGVVGFLAYGSALVLLARTGRRAVRVTPTGSLERGVAVGFLGCAVGFIAASTVANVFSNVVSLWYFFTFAGLASAIAARHRADTNRYGGRPADELDGDRSR